MRILLATKDDTVGWQITASKSGPYTAVPSDFVPVDISGGSVPITLPNAAADGTRIGVKIIAISGAPGSTTCTVAPAGGDVFNIPAGSTLLTLTALGQGVWLQYKASLRIWYVVTRSTPLGVPLGAAKLGSDGSLDGPGSTGLPASVLKDSNVAGAPLLDSTGMSPGQVLVLNGGGTKLVPGTAGSDQAGVVSLERLSGTPRSVTDWGPLINTALAGGARHFLLDDFIYPFTTPLDLVNSHPVIFEGVIGRAWATFGSFTFSWPPSCGLLWKGGASPVVTKTDGAITAPNRTLTCASAPFRTGVEMTGYPITIAGAGTGGADLVTQIKSVTSTTVVEVYDAAVTSVTGATVTFSDFTKAIDARGADGIEFRDMCVSYDSTAFDGILVDMRSKDSWASGGMFHNAVVAPRAPAFWNGAHLANAYALVHLNGHGEQFKASESMFAGAKALFRGQYQNNADDAEFDHCLFAYGWQAQFFNVGRWWRFHDCVHAGWQDFAFTDPGPAFGSDGYMGDNIHSIFTVDGGSHWDWSRSLLYDQKKDHPWHLKLTGQNLFFTPVTTGPDIRLAGPGDFFLDGANLIKNDGVVAIDVGDATNGAQKTNVHIDNVFGGEGTVNFTTFLANVDTGHDDIYIGTARLRQRKYRWGHETIYKTGHHNPGVATSAGQTALSAILIFGSDEAGLIRVDTTGSGAVAGALVDVTFTEAWPSHAGVSDPNNMRSPCVILTPMGFPGLTNGATSAAAQAYVESASPGNAGWTLALANPVSGPQRLCWYYRVIKL